MKEASDSIVIVGGGFAGINACKGLKRANLDITILDKKNHHLFQPPITEVKHLRRDGFSDTYPAKFAGIRQCALPCLSTSFAW